MNFSKHVSNFICPINKLTCNFVLYVIEDIQVTNVEILTSLVFQTTESKNLWLSTVLPVHLQYDQIRLYFDKRYMDKRKVSLLIRVLSDFQRTKKMYQQM